MQIFGKSVSFFFLLFVVLVIAATAHRFSFIQSHFAHFDDIGVANTITDIKAHAMDTTAAIAEARTRAAEGRETLRSRVTLKLADYHLDGLITGPYSVIQPVLAMPRAWSYPPLPFLLTPFLVSSGQSYESTKFWGRLPSLLFTVATILIVAAIAFRLSPVAPWVLAIIMVLPIAFSREYTVMAAQMHYYAASGTASAILLFMTARDAARSAGNFDLRFAVSRGLVLLLLLYLSYQVVLLVPGYFAALVIGFTKQQPLRRWLSRGWPVIAAGVIFTAGLIPTYLLTIRYLTATHWNTGIHQEFLFAPAGGFLSTIMQALYFLPTNSWIVIQSLVSPAPEDSLAAILVTGAAIVCAAVGLFVGLRRVFKPGTWSVDAAIALYVGLAIIIFLGLVFTGRLTLSPTRHLVVYLPVLAVIAGWGFWNLAFRISRHFSSTQAAVFPSRAVTGAAIIVAVIFYAGFAAFRSERSDALSELRVADIAGAAQADLIVGYNWTAGHLQAMPSVLGAFPVAELTYSGEVRYLSAKPAFRRVLFISHRTPFDAATCRQFFAPANGFGDGYLRACDEPARARKLAAVTSPVEVEFSSRTENGKNQFFATLLDLETAR